MDAGGSHLSRPKMDMGGSHLLRPEMDAGGSHLLRPEMDAGGSQSSATGDGRGRVAVLCDRRWTREGRSPLRPKMYTGGSRLSRPPVQRHGRNKCDPPMKHLPTTNYQLPSTNYQLPSTNYHLPTANYPQNAIENRKSKNRKCELRPWRAGLQHEKRTRFLKPSS